MIFFIIISNKLLTNKLNIIIIDSFLYKSDILNNIPNIFQINISINITLDRFLYVQKSLDVVAQIA